MSASGTDYVNLSTEDCICSKLNNPTGIEDVFITIEEVTSPQFASVSFKTRQGKYFFINILRASPEEVAKCCKIVCKLTKGEFLVHKGNQIDAAVQLHSAH